MKPTIVTTRQVEISTRTGLIVGWTLSGLVTALAVVSWGSSFSWQFQGLSTYLIFPVFGLLAFSLMWGHYMMGLTKRLLFPAANLDSYFRYTGFAVLAAIMIHPGLLIYQRFRDGYGLPPESYAHYVAPAMTWLLPLGSVCFFIFLAYELRRWFGKRTWWKYVVYAGDAAMIGIFYHGLRLGDQTQIGWYHIVWIFYGITLIGVLLYTYIGKFVDLPGARKV